MNYDEYRISKLRSYLLGIIDTLTQDSNSQINADMLSNEVDNYSLDKIPTDYKVERWISMFIHLEVEENIVKIQLIIFKI